MAEGPHNHCSMHGLAESPVGNVALCPACGVIHVTLQYVTVRLEAGTFAQFTHMLAQAHAALIRGDIANDVAEPAQPVRH